MDPCGKYEICNEACNPDGYGCGMYVCIIIIRRFIFIIFFDS